MSHPSLSRLADRGYLDAVLEVGFGIELWPIQRRICRAISKPRARVAVRSCNASGKTAVGGGIALGYYSSYEDAKVVSTSAREDQLRHNLWGEIRRFHSQRRIEVPGNLPPSAMELRDGGRMMIGVSPREPEGIKGYHSEHMLIIVEEASYLEAEMAGALGTLAASGDARILCLFNPSDSNTWIADQCESGAWEVIDIPAWETPNLKRIGNQEILERWGVEVAADRIVEDIPNPIGAALIDPSYLDELLKTGRGPGTYDWETSVEARFWSQGSDVVVPREWYDAGRGRVGVEGPAVIGVDIAAYGDSESVCGVRQGNRLVEVYAISGVRADNFWKDHVRPLVERYDPQYVVWDADGVGAGSYTDAYAVAGKRALPFRGHHPLQVDYNNMRSMHYWNLHRRFEWADIAIGIDDTTLRKQLTSITYQRTAGRIAIDGKQKLRKAGLRNVDRADAVMYSYSCEPPVQREKPLTEDDLLHRDAGEEMFWARRERTLKAKALPRARRPTALR